MLHKIKEFIQNYQLFTINYPILLACSGGRDSVFLADVLHKLGYSFALAHCNFRLRGEESEGDAEFVRTLALQYNVDFFIQNFNTKEFATVHNYSIQEAARHLRYSWLEEIRKENGYAAIVTAHHADDQAETLLLHLAQGCGLKGIQGMLPKNRHIARPLLVINRSDIDKYIAEFQIPYRDDSSNAKDKYTRNYIRHHILPTLDNINPKSASNIAHSAILFQEANILYEQAINTIAKKVVKNFDSHSFIDYQYILQHSASRTLCYSLLSPYGASAALVEEIRLDILKGVINGAQYFTSSHRIIVERNHLCILPLNKQEESILVAFDKIPKQIHFGEFIIKISQKPISKVNMKYTERYAYFDAETLSLPFRIRYHRSGDYFYPLGMTKDASHQKVGKKKVAKYFKDEKFSTLQKERTPLLFAGERLIWIVGSRMDDRHKILATTKHVIQMQIIKSPKLL